LWGMTFLSGQGPPLMHHVSTFFWSDATPLHLSVATYLASWLLTFGCCRACMSQALTNFVQGA
jgi:hypothetical protein